MIERQLDIATRDGATTTFIAHPDRAGPFPVVLFFMDAPGIREELRDMARRIASVGYYVVLPNLFYRAGVMELGPMETDPESPWRKRMFALMATLTIDGVMSDAEALLAFAATDASADVRRVGCLGYCMSGQFAINAAAKFSDKVKVAASFYGTHLVTDNANSPHRVAADAPGELYFGTAEVDRWAEPAMIAALRAGVEPKAEVEMYSGAEHGFAFPSRPAFNRTAADRHWVRLFSLLERNLK